MFHEAASFASRYATGNMHFVRALAPLLLIAPTLAQAEPVTVTLATHVPVGKKPTLTVRAETRVVNLVLDLTRAEDGARLVARAPALNVGQSRVFPLGDGEIGTAHWDGTLSLTHGAGESWSGGIMVDTIVNAEIRVGYRRDHLYLDRHVLEFQVSRPSKKLDAELIVYDDKGQVIGEVAQSYDLVTTGRWLAISWEPRGDSPVMMMKLHVSDEGGFVDETLTPWSVSIPHEEVNFATNSAAIDESERPKLNDAYEKIAAEVTKAEKLGVRCSLFIAGYTDTVGSREKNQRLSLDRAKAIAGYLRSKGLTIKVSYQGFGEGRPKVQTPDETDEPANRRADYTISAEGPPSMGQVFQWKEAK